MFRNVEFLIMKSFVFLQLGEKLQELIFLLCQGGLDKLSGSFPHLLSYL